MHDRKNFFASEVLPNILSRITAHRKALFSVLHVGVARGHWGNPVASVHVEKVYASPVLSGLSALVLSKSEINLLEIHYKKTIQCLLPHSNFLSLAENYHSQIFRQP